MLSRTTRMKLAVFAVLALTVVAYTGLHFARLGRYVGARGYYVVKVNLSDAGGVFPNANVAYRGVSVGRVGALRLTANGVQADLDISRSAPKIPADVQVVVADLSAVGEEYVDLRPGASSGPYLTANMVIPQQHAQAPPSVTTLLTSIDNLANSLPGPSLRTLVNELYNAFAGQGPNLQTLLDSAKGFTGAAQASLPQTTALIDDGHTVLATQQDETAAIESWGSSIDQLAQQLDSSDSDLRRLIAATPPALAQVSGLLRDNDPDLGILLANLLTTSDIAVTRPNGLEEILSVLPADIAAGSTVITPKGASFGVSLTFFDPLPCTAGYGGTVFRNGVTTTPTSRLNTGARCTEPASSGIDVRGSAHAPSGGVPAPARPGPG